MSKGESRPGRERIADWLLLFGIVLSVIGLVLVVAGRDAGTVIFGGALIFASQLLHPFWRPKWKPVPPPPLPTLGDFGLAPKKGERFTTSEPAKVDVIVWWKPMGTNTIDGVLPAGTLVSVDHDHESGGNHVYVTASDADVLYTLLVPV